MLTEKNLDIILESELEFKPYSPSFDTFKKEPVTFLLVNALKYLTEDQRKQLYNALGERLSPTPASAEDEAKALYSMPEEPAGYAEVYTLRNVRGWQQQAHITCAGMYTDTIDKLKAENEALKAELNELKIKNYGQKHNL